MRLDVKKRRAELQARFKALAGLEGVTVRVLPPPPGGWGRPGALARGVRSPAENDNIGAFKPPSATALAIGGVVLGLAALVFVKRKIIIKEGAVAYDIAGEVAKLRQIMPRLTLLRATEIMPFLLSAMREAEITTPLRSAAFFAQLAVESGEFRYMEELASGDAYDWRKDLGNDQPGDGRRYKGRGPIQLTGKKNYRAAGQALGLDLEGNPEQASTLPVGFRTAAWFWKSKGLNALADAGDFGEITRRINGAADGPQTHRAERDAYYLKAKAALGA